MGCRLLIVLVLVCVVPSSAGAQDANGRLKVYLDCNNCFGDYIREEVDIVEYVRDPAEADVHIIVSSSDTGSGGLERAVAFIGIGRFKGMDFKIAGDFRKRRQRRHAAAAVGDRDHHRPAELPLERRCQRRLDRRGRAGGPARPERSRDGPLEFLGDEPAGVGGHDRRREQPRARSGSRRFGADRITDDWKITMGVEVEHSREDFDLDEDEPLRAERNSAISTASSHEA